MHIRVYEVVADSNVCQGLIPIDQNTWRTKVLDFSSCSSKADGWVSPALKVNDPKRERGSFFYVAAGAFATDARGKEVIESLNCDKIELLPLRVSDSDLWAVNVLQCDLSFLDLAKTKFHRSPQTQVPFGVEEYVFNAESLRGVNLFKTPRGEYPGGTFIFSVSDDMYPGRDFRKLVADERLTGLRFRELWTDGD
ncbi:MAG TPA: hypothetical protein VH143_04750 [Kofleriaceae bacterium]|jgi:hypothetical protein|nr:hypothetical protein [Kofleriaceae bacterium]